MAVGSSLIPPKVPDPASNFLEAVYINAFINHFFALGVGALFWWWAGRKKAKVTGALDGYEAIRSATWHTGFSFFPFFFLIGPFFFGSGDLLSPVLLTLGLALVLDIWVSHRQTRTRAAMWAICWTPVVLVGLLVTPMVSRTEVQCGHWAFIFGILCVALLASLNLPLRWDGAVTGQADWVEKETKGT